MNENKVSVGWMTLVFLNRSSGRMPLMLRISELTTADRGIILMRLQVDSAPAKVVDCTGPIRKASMDLKNQLSPSLVLPYAGTPSWAGLSGTL